MLRAHLVFATKRRGKVLTAEHLDQLKAIFEAVCADFEVELRPISAAVTLMQFTLMHGGLDGYGCQFAPDCL